MKEPMTPGKANHSGSKKTSKTKKNGVKDWKDTAKELRGKLNELEKAYKELKSKGLDERHAVKLKRLEHLHGQLMNMQVCKECQKSLDSMLHEAKWVK